MQLPKHIKVISGSAVWLMALCMLVLGPACGSGYDVEKEDEIEEGGEIIATLTGVINYSGDRTGARLVVGMINQWPMTGPPVRFWDVPGFTGSFPVTYQFDLDEYLEGKAYYLAAFLDVDENDVNLMMNAEVDPLDLPDEDEEPLVIEPGIIVRDFVLLDPEDVDWWWVDGE
ncbi:MAG: hypothetical protein P9L99_04610 [Candidatus Lernaella stagnicola]|nr:hypothetical protein [Candidatus Lernaella stagnicola]